MDAIQLQILTEINALLKQGKQGMPFVTLSFGMSLDGKIATYTGDSKYISGPETRQFVHELRDRHDAILVGIQTVNLDHPLLTTRLNDRQGKHAIRVILDSTLKIDPIEPLLSQPANTKTMVITKASAHPSKVKALQSHQVSVWLDPTPGAHIDLPWLLATLKANGIHSLLVEGGGTIHESFIKAGLFDVIFAQISPLLIGGKDAKTPVEGQGFATLKDATQVAFHNHFQSGRDIIIFAKKG
jgi:diaminohydroxyphosphoribosylaminopyrimidine deaminase / 5-amino-6-(5-phosphoribosylamino)uracil reductase